MTAVLNFPATARLMSVNLAGVSDIAVRAGWVRIGWATMEGEGGDTSLAHFHGHQSAGVLTYFHQASGLVAVVDLATGYTMAEAPGRNHWPAIESSEISGTNTVEAVTLYSSNDQQAVKVLAGFTAGGIAKLLTAVER